MGVTKYHAMKTFPVLNQEPRHEDVLGGVGMTPRILNLGARWKWVVSFTLRSLYRRRKNPPLPIEWGGGCLDESYPITR
jgi:hypothetical protein